MKRDSFARGYYCAVAVLIRMDGGVGTQARELFAQGGDPMKADAFDIELFREHGLLPADRAAAQGAAGRDTATPALAPNSR